MFRYIIKRIIILIPVIIGITIILFAISKMMPGDPLIARLPPGLKPEQREIAYEALYIRFGLDKSLPEQYLRWMYSLIVDGDLGYSIMFNRPVTDAITEPLLNTIILNAFVNFFYLLIALPVGIKMATKRGSLFDNGWQVFSLVTYSLPSFFVGLTLIFIFGCVLGWLPLGGMPYRSGLGTLGTMLDWARYLALPVATLTLISFAGAMRYVRNAMIDALSQDYIRTARSKGLSEKVVVYSHAFRNALIPISTIIVGTIFSLLAGAAVTESVFQYNGIGKLLVTAVQNRDTMMVVSMNLFLAIVSVVAVLMSDIIYGLVDPRIKLK